MVTVQGRTGGKRSEGRYTACQTCAETFGQTGAMIKVLMSNGEGEKITVILPKLLLFFY